MENRNRTSRYQLNQDSVIEERRFFYATDRNAVLAPVYEPTVPEHQPQQAPRPRKRPVVLPQLDPARKRRKKIRVALVLSVLLFTACACAVCMRNAQIFQNNLAIQKLGKQINNTTMELNQAKQELAAATDMDAYLELAKEEYGMDFPAEDQILEVRVAASAADVEELQQIQKNGNLFDDILDWFNSFGRS